jgi:hypothetical protein
VTAVAPKPITSRPYPARRAAKGSVLLKMMHTTDPKDIAILYLVTTFAFFLVGGAMALLIRGELAMPGQQFLSNEQYNQLFTMHGTIMLLLYATPTLFGFANYIVPLQIGAPDVAFPRLNALSYWLFLFGALIVMSSFLTPGALVECQGGDLAAVGVLGVGGREVVHGVEIVACDLDLIAARNRDAPAVPDDDVVQDLPVPGRGERQVRLVDPVGLEELGVLGLPPGGV